MSKDMGAPQADGLAGAAAPEPHSRLGPTGGIPSAVPTLTVSLTDDLDPNAVGELLLSYINDKSRWGYGTQEFLRGDFREVVGLPSLYVRTLCCGCFAKCQREYRRIGWWHSDALNLDLYLHWDGDGTIVFQHPAWTLENTDCKKSYEWEWAHHRGHWSSDLPADYYDECEPFLRQKCAASAIEARQGQDAQRLDAKHESAVGNAETPKTNRETQP